MFWEIHLNEDLAHYWDEMEDMSLSKAAYLYGVLIESDSDNY